MPPASRFASILVCLIGVSAFGANQDKSLTKEFISSAFELPYDFDADLTDVILVNAFLTNSTQISRSANKLIEIFESNPDPISRPMALSNEFYARHINADNSGIKLLQERTQGDRYRLDSTIAQAEFHELKWMGGEFTNVFPFLKAEISVPPSRGETQWLKYAVQSGHNHVAVNAL